MKNDLDLLIDHFQAERDYLKSELDACIAEWDFEGAMAFKEAFARTNQKLSVLLSLQNPHFQKIKSLESGITKLEKIISDNMYDRGDFSESTIQMMQNSIRKILKKQKDELEQLKAIKKESRVDDDKILELFEMIENNEIHSIEFDVMINKVKLILKVVDDEAILTLISSNHVPIDGYFHHQSPKILKDLGWDVSTYSKTIPNFRQYDKLLILEELSIIYFEIFNIFGAERNIKVE
jgi:uncharacterized protein YukE